MYYVTLYKGTECNQFKHSSNQPVFYVTYKANTSIKAQKNNKIDEIVYMYASNIMMFLKLSNLVFLRMGFMI